MRSVIRFPSEYPPNIMICVYYFNLRFRIFATSIRSGELKELQCTTSVLFATKIYGYQALKIVYFFLKFYSCKKYLLQRKVVLAYVYRKNYSQYIDAHYCLL